MKHSPLNTLKRIFLALQQQEKEVPAPGKERVWQTIRNKVAQKKRQKQRRILLYTSLSIASSIALLFIVNSIYTDTTPSADSLLQYAQQMEAGETNLETSDDIILKLSAQKQVTIQKEEEVKYSSDGKIQVNQKKIAQAYTEKEKNEEMQYNQLIVPLGKRTRLHLSDGTNLWVNSGTQVIYPVVFDEKVREIFVDGEVYIDVFKDAAHPFIVRTKQFNVSVLGTSFNMSAYSKEAHSTVVLVNGSVNITNKTAKEVNLKPGQLTEITNGIAQTPQAVDVEKYICWTQDILILEDVPLSNVFRKLRLYYGKEFVSSPKIDALFTSGKLELKKDFSEIMRTITFSLPISYTESGNKVYLEYHGTTE